MSLRTRVLALEKIVNGDPNNIVKLPIEDPKIEGALWNDDGMLMISKGPPPVEEIEEETEEEEIPPETNDGTSPNRTPRRRR